MAYKSRLTANQLFIGYLLLAAAFFLALAVLDHTVMWGASGSGGGYPDWMYRYWMALGLVIISVAALATWMAYASDLPKKRVPAVFLTVILLFIGGLLDLFFYMLAVLKGESYSFAVWSAQWKWFVDDLHWLPTWDWPQQIVWSLACFILIAYIWHKTKD